MEGVFGRRRQLQGQGGEMEATVEEFEKKNKFSSAALMDERGEIELLSN